MQGTGKVVRIRRTETAERQDVRELILAAIAKVDYPGTAPIDLFYEIAGHARHEGLGIFVGVENDKPKALAVAMLPVSRTMMYPQILIAYNIGTRPLAVAVAARVRAWIVAAGYDAASSVNLRHSDAAFKRGMRHFGQPETLASVILFRF